MWLNACVYARAVASLYWHLLEMWCFDSVKKQNQTYSIKIEWKRFPRSVFFSCCRLANVCQVTCVILCLCLRWFWICMQSESNEMIPNITFYRRLFIVPEFQCQMLNQTDFVAAVVFFHLTMLFNAHLYGLIFYDYSLELLPFFVELCIQFMVSWMHVIRKKRPHAANRMCLYTWQDKVFMKIKNTVKNHPCANIIKCIHSITLFLLPTHTHTFFTAFIVLNRIRRSKK